MTNTYTVSSMMNKEATFSFEKDLTLEEAKRIFSHKEKDENTYYVAILDNKYNTLKETFPN